MGSVLFSRAGKGVALATVAALLLTAAEPQMAQAKSSSPAPVAAGNGPVASPATDISARKRHARRRHYRGGNAAGMAFMGMALGTMGAIIAEQQRRDYYRDRYYYGGGYPYYGRHYYGGPAYYGRPYYGY
jgi:hypothetical protein